MAGSGGIEENGGYGRRGFVVVSQAAWRVCPLVGVGAKTGDLAGVGKREKKQVAAVDGQGVELAVGGVHGCVALFAAFMAGPAFDLLDSRSALAG